jgi:predicted dehydrogenase/kynurenine formamidase
MKRLRGLCIGAGYFSQFHFDAWRRMDDVQIVGVCDLDEAKARAAAEPLGNAATYTNAATAIAELKPDFVDIITRPATHLPIVELAAGDGRAIICQKPLADDFPAARAIVETARQRGSRLMVHENFRFQPWYREIKRLVGGGAIGRRLHSLAFRARPGDGWRDDAYLARQPYFRQMPRLLIHETGVHFIDTFRYLAGEIDEVTAVLRRLNPVIAGEDAGLLTFRFAGGAVGVWDANRFNETTAADPRYTFGTLLVEADGGSLRLDEDGRLFIKPLGLPEREHQYVHQRRGFAGDCVYFTQRHFIDCLTSGIEFETSGDEYLKTLAVVEAAYASANVPAQSNVRSQTVGSRRGRRIVDLSVPIDNGLRGVSITPFTTIAGQGWNSTTLSLYSHCGTHMDAPKHFLGDSAATIDQQSLEVCCGPAKVVDLTPIGPSELITVEQLCERAERCGPIAAGDRLLLRTDWSRRLGTPQHRDGLPRISLELARWLAQQRVALIGVEPPSVADVNDLRELTDVHQTLFRGGVAIVEGLVNLDQLARPVVEFIALPLKIVAGDGCPVRAVAIEECH